MVFSDPVCQRYVLNTIIFGTVDTIGLVSPIRSGLNSLVQVVHFKAIEKWEQSVRLMEVIVD